MDFRMFLLVPVSMACQFIDSSLGMGYGIMLTTILIAMGFEPLMVVPAVLLSDFVAGIMAGFFHHKVRNVDFRARSQDTKILVLLSFFAVFGAVLSALFFLKLPSTLVRFWINVVVIYMALIILLSRKQYRPFHWGRMFLLTGIASINKGMSGGGYGPLVMGGQILSGIETKKAVGITSMSEGFVCFAALVMYILYATSVDWMLAPWLLAGSVLAVPIAVKTVKFMKEEKLRDCVAIVLLCLGLFAFGKMLVETFNIRFVFSSLIGGRVDQLIVF